MPRDKPKLPFERDGIIADNPEKFYWIGQEIGKGQFALTKHCTHKEKGGKLAAKIIKFNVDSQKFAVREYDFMTSMNMEHKGLVKLHDAFLVQKYLILIMDCADGADGQHLMNVVTRQPTLTEDIVAGWVKQLCAVLAHLHASNAVHLDIRPSNIRFDSQNSLKLVDYNVSRILSKPSVADAVGEQEFCAPETLRFEPVHTGTDMWSLAVLTYILLSGISPFYDESEDEIQKKIVTVNWKFSPDMKVSSEAQDFIKKCLVRAPGSRMSAADALKHKWLSDAYAKERTSSTLNVKEGLEQMRKRFSKKERAESVQASVVFKTFEEVEYDSPTEYSEDEDDDE